MTTALEAVNAEPRLSWMSAPARALLAVALNDGRPLRVISSVDDAAILARAEHAIRCENISLRDALDAARMTEIDETMLRGIVRFAAALSDDSAELDALLMEYGSPNVRALTREQAVRIAIDLFAREEAPRGVTFEQIVDAFPQDDVAQVLGDDAAADVVGRCNECSGPVVAGDTTIAIGWPASSPKWELFTETGARTGTITKEMRELAELVAAGRAERSEYEKLKSNYDAALTKAPRKGTKLALLLAGELEMLCSPCAMAMTHAGREIGAPNPADDVALGSDTVVSVVAGLLDRSTAIGIAIRSIDVDAPRVEKMRVAVGLVGDDAELRCRILALAWKLGQPLRIRTVPADLARLDELVDHALRGGSVERLIERAA